MRTASWFRRHAILCGIVLMYLFTWPIELANAGVATLEFLKPFSLFVGYGIVAATLLITGLESGKNGIFSLLKRFIIWRVGWIWYLAAFALIPCIDLMGITLHSFLYHAPIDFSTAIAYKIFGPSVNLYVLIIPFFLYDTLTNGEEIGWRGFVLPRLQERYSAFSASIILGLIWAVWHVPKFMPHWDTVMFLWWMLDVMAKTIFFTWIYNNTKGSLLLVTLFHASCNTAGVLLPIANTVSNNYMNNMYFIILIEFILIGFILWKDGLDHLSNSLPEQTLI